MYNFIFQFRFCLFILIFCFGNNNNNNNVHGGMMERHLIYKLLENYDKLERPVVNESEPLNVTFDLTLQQIIDVDEKNQILISNIWLNIKWNDANLHWNPEQYGNIKSIRIAPDRIWIPDVLLYNSADERFDSTFRTNVVVGNDGSMLFVPPGIFKSTCQIDITWFPFDDQKCDMKFGSWTHGGFAMDVTPEQTSADISAYIQNSEWVLVSVPSKKNILSYECCPEPYIDVTYSIHIKRRTLYYGFNLIIPCIILSSMTLLGFSLPPESGEKLHLGVTILLSMTVFLVQLGKILPATSDSVSIIALYFGFIMVMVAFSVVMTVVVLNFHHRTSETQEMGPKLKKILLYWLPKIVGIDRPGIKPPKQCVPKSKTQLVASKILSGAKQLVNGGVVTGTGSPGMIKTPSSLSRAESAASRYGYRNSGKDGFAGNYVPSPPPPQQQQQQSIHEVPTAAATSESSSISARKNIEINQQIDPQQQQQQQPDYFHFDCGDQNNRNNYAADIYEHEHDCVYAKMQQKAKKDTDANVSIDIDHVPHQIFATEDDNNNNNNIFPRQSKADLFRNNLDSNEDRDDGDDDASGRQNQSDEEDDEDDDLDISISIVSESSPTDATILDGDERNLKSIPRQQTNGKIGRQKDEKQGKEKEGKYEYCSNRKQRPHSHLPHHHQHHHLHDHLNDQNGSKSPETLRHEYEKMRRRHKLLEILLEMRFITDRLRQEDATKELIAEWRYAATVLDRCCLILFTFFTVLSLVVCLGSAPQLIV